MRLIIEHTGERAGQRAARRIANRIREHQAHTDWSFMPDGTIRKIILFLGVFLLFPAMFRAQDRHIVLWDNTSAPTSNDLTGDEVEMKPGQWTNTQTAEMWIYQAGANATGQGIVFFPGGGYANLSVGNGHKTAEWFAKNGITAAVVK